MEITQQVRDFASQRGLDTGEALKAGMAEKSSEFLDNKDKDIYVATEQVRSAE